MTFARAAIEEGHSHIVEARGQYCFALARFAAGLCGRRHFSGTARSTAASGSNVYEGTRAVDEYLAFHYAPKEHTIPYNFGPSEALDFPARMARLAVQYSSADRRDIAYDIGCAVGRGTFELTATFKRVVGVDFSHAFIAAAQHIKEKGELAYEATEQASLRSKLVARVPVTAIAERASFRQGDACNLGDIGKVDCITAVNLLCRVSNPQAFLLKAIDVLRPGGILLLVSPFSWLEEYTPKERWLGGKLDAHGKPIDSHIAVSATLGDTFDLVARSNEAFLLREHARKFQWGVSDCTVWRRR